MEWNSMCATRYVNVKRSLRRFAPTNILLQLPQIIGNGLLNEQFLVTSGIPIQFSCQRLRELELDKSSLYLLI